MPQGEQQGEDGKSWIERQTFNPGFATGAVVTVHGLSERGINDGQRGVVESFDSNEGKYYVRIDGDSDTIQLDVLDEAWAIELIDVQAWDTPVGMMTIDLGENIDELNLRITEFNNFLSTRKEKNIRLIGHGSFIRQYKDKKINFLDNGDKELLHCHPYKINI